MTMNQQNTSVIPFAFDDALVRALWVENDPWFVLADVCRVLEHSNSRMAAQGLDDDEKGVSTVYTPGGPQEMTIISESGLYALIMSSRKPQAKRFRKWVTAEVLPSLRKTGRYAMPGAEVEQDRPKVRVQANPGQRLSKGEINAYTGYLKMMSSIFGEAVAAQVYQATPLAGLAEVTPIGGDDPGKSALPVELDGFACLAHLCGCQLTPRCADMIGALMAQSRKNARVREQLGAAGVFVDPTNWDGFVAIACAHPQLQALFAMTDWAPDWSEALLTLDGARQSQGAILFPDRKRKAVLVPWDCVAQAEGR